MTKRRGIRAKRSLAAAGWIAVAAALFLVDSAQAAPPYPVKDCSHYTVQMDLNACANDHADAADKALNAIYKQVLASRKTGAEKESLRQAELGWMRYRDKTCTDMAGPREDGGSIWPMDWANCQESETAKRIGVLQRMLVCTAGASVCNPH
jgi:uncharacterized protein YecT (DUF1311 family)